MKTHTGNIYQFRSSAAIFPLPSDGNPRFSNLFETSDHSVLKSIAGGSPGHSSPPLEEGRELEIDGVLVVIESIKVIVYDRYITPQLFDHSHGESNEVSIQTEIRVHQVKK